MAKAPIPPKPPQQPSANKTQELIDLLTETNKKLDILIEIFVPILKVLKLIDTWFPLRITLASVIVSIGIWLVREIYIRVF
ncbi:MAG: hypothetical protein O4861_05530 [Trichodesmium sp. St16_bin4-tuft]|nr:hypothetical protein [Trichodesmium sp. St16_bin4-tuft]